MKINAPSWTWLCLLALMACDLPLPGQEVERVRDELNETAVAAFVSGPRDRALPPGPLAFRAGSIYSAEPQDGPEGPWVWQVRLARAEIVNLPLTSRDRFVGVELSADVLVRFEQRYCGPPAAGGPPQRCEPWHEAACCNTIWKRNRGEWAAAAP